MNQYITENGLVMVQKGIKTENGILFRAILDNWFRITKDEYYLPLWKQAISSTMIKKGQFQANPPEQGEHFSRDNMLGLYCLCRIHGLEKTIKTLPLLIWNKQKWYNPKNWHPNKWAVFLAFKYSIFKYNPLIYIMALFSVLDSDFKKTSGPNLWFLTLTVLKIEWPLIWAQKKYGKNKPTTMFKKFEFSHYYYFSGAYKFENHDNIIIEKVREYYELKRNF